VADAADLDPSRELVEGHHANPVMGQKLIAGFKKLRHVTYQAVGLCGLRQREQRQSFLSALSCGRQEASVPAGEVLRDVELTVAERGWDILDEHLVWAQAARILGIEERRCR